MLQKYAIQGCKFEENQRIDSRHDPHSIFSRESTFSLNHVVMSVIQMDFDSCKVKRTCTPAIQFGTDDTPFIIDSGYNFHKGCMNFNWNSPFTLYTSHVHKLKDYFVISSIRFSPKIWFYLHQWKLWLHNMWYDQAKWVRTRKHRFGDRVKQRLKISPFVFYCFDNLSIGHNFVMTCPILMGFSAKQSSLNGE